MNPTEAKAALDRATADQGAAQAAFDAAARELTLARLAVAKAETDLSAARDLATQQAEAAARRKAQSLAKKHGVSIERETDLESRPWFVSVEEWQDTDRDPYQGDHYAFSWCDVLSRVETYVAAKEAA